MTTTTPVRAADLHQTPRDDAARVLIEQAGAFAAELRALDAHDWSQATDCSRWDVREVAAHVAGALEDGARVTVMVRHLLRARRRPPGTPEIDAINDAQVADRAGVAGPAIAAEIARLGPRAARARRRIPGPVRSRPTGSDDLPPGATFGYLVDVIYARDLWMHRVDVARATSRPMQVTTSDTDIAGQVVRDLDRLGGPGPSWVLELTGRVSGSWQVGDGDPVGTVRADTVDYLRLLSGRPGQVDMEVTGDPSLRGRAAAARVVF